MKPASTPLYRAVETLLDWLVPIMANQPKSLPYQILGGHIVTSVSECLDAVIMAMKSRGEQRVEYIDILIHHMTTVKSKMRILCQRRTINHAQEAKFLELAAPIAIQSGGWRAKTVEKLSNVHG